MKHNKKDFYFLFHILISSIKAVMNKTTRTPEKPAFQELPAFPKWIP